MHSSRMRTARNSSRPGVSTRYPPEAGTPPGPDPPPPHWDQAPQAGTPQTRHPPPWTRHLTILPCPKLHLWAVTRMHSSRMRTACSLTVCHARPPARHARPPLPPPPLWTEFLHDWGKRLASNIYWISTYIRRRSESRLISA